MHKYCFKLWIRIVQVVLYIKLVKTVIVLGSKDNMNLNNLIMRTQKSDLEQQMGVV